MSELHWVKEEAQTAEARLLMWFNSAWQIKDGFVYLTIHIQVHKEEGLHISCGTKGCCKYILLRKVSLFKYYMIENCDLWISLKALVVTYWGKYCWHQFIWAVLSKAPSRSLCRWLAAFQRCHTSGFLFVLFWDSLISYNTSPDVIVPYHNNWLKKSPAGSAMTALLSNCGPEKL